MFFTLKPDLEHFKDLADFKTHTFLSIGFVAKQ